MEPSYAAQDPFLRTLYTQGRFLYDSSGQKVILRGVNLSVLDDYSFPQTNPTSKLNEVAKSGANAVRIQWYVDYGQANRPAYTVQDLDNFLAACTAKGIIPILTLFDATFQDIGLLTSKLIPWWTSAPVVAVLKKYEQHLIVNLGNEVGLYRFAGETPQALNAYTNAYKSAITSIRQQGLDLPIMIDAPDGGSTLGIFNTIGQELVNHDPNRNIILSAHAYWAGYNGVPQIQPAINANLPIFFGEIANSQDEFINGVTQYGYYDLDGSNERNPPLNGSTYTYQALLTSIKQSEIGWLAWAWWQDFDARRQLATGGNFANLTPYGNDIVNNPNYGLQATAQRSTIFVTTFNGTNGNDALTGTAGNDAIKPLRGIDTVNGGTGTDLLVVDYSSNLFTGQAPQTGIVSSLVSSGGASFNGSYKAYFTSTSFDQVSFNNIERFLIVGTGANDNITTGDGNDFLYGGEGNDTLIGGDGNDIIIGVNPNGVNPGRGEVDILTGGAGSDRFILGDTSWIGYDDGNTATTGNNDYAQIIGFNSLEDKVQLKGAASDYLLVVSDGSANLLIDKPGVEPDELIAVFQNITGLSLNAFEYINPIPINSTNINVITPSQQIGSSSETAQSGVTPTNSASGIFFNLSDNNDGSTNSPLQLSTFEVSNLQFRLLSGNDNVRGTAGADTILGNRGNDAIAGLDGNDVLQGGIGSDTLTGGNGDDQLFGNLSNDTLNGDDSNDILRGGAGSDVINGGTGNDLIYGDRNQDLLTGGAGADNFVLQTGVDFTSPSLSGADVILDFNFAEGDRLGLTSDIAASSVTFESISQSIDGQNPLISTAILNGSNNYLGILYGVNSNSLNSGSLFVNVAT